MISKLKQVISRLVRTTDSFLYNFLRSGSGNPAYERIIYDIGLHVGQDTDFYLRKGYKVVAVEANPELVEMARTKFSKEILTKQLVVVNCGIVEAEVNRRIDFYVNEELSEWSSFDESLACREGHRHHVVQVECRTLASVIRRFGEPYYIKIDIEGNDPVALASLLDGGYRPKYISVENGNCGMLSMLVQAGYNHFKYVQQNSVHKQQPPKPPLHGKYVNYSFSNGASGLFGEEVPVDWLSEQEVIRKISKVWDPESGDKNKNHDDQIHGWFDLHAQYSKNKSGPVSSLLFLSLFLSTASNLIFIIF